MKIIFAGTPEFAATILERLLQSQHDIVCVYTQPDKPAGRGRRLQQSAVKKLALQHQIPIEQPTTLKDDEALQTLTQYQCDVMVVAAYGLLLPSTVLNYPPLGCVNVHGSILPRWRGAAPIQRAIMAGDDTTGISIMSMEEGLDTGPTWLMETCPIHGTDTAQGLHDRLAQLGGDALIKALPFIEKGELPVPQDDTQATYAHKLTKQEGSIDWTRTALEIDRQVRALNPWPVSFTQYQGKILRIWSTTPGDSETGAMNSKPGTIINIHNNGIDVATGVGFITLNTLQLPGAKPMGIKDILNGHPNLFQINTQLGNT